MAVSPSLVSVSPSTGDARARSAQKIVVCRDFERVEFSSSALVLYFLLNHMIGSPHLWLLRKLLQLNGPD